MDDDARDETFDFMAARSRDFFHGVEIALVLAAVILAATYSNSGVLVFLKYGLFAATMVLSVHWGVRFSGPRGPLLAFVAAATLGTVVGCGLITAASRLADAAYVQLHEDQVAASDARIAARRETYSELAQAGCGPENIELPHCWTIFSKMGAREDAAFAAALKKSGKSPR